MADDIVRLGAADYDELLAHLARCFREPIDRGFDRFLGGVYGPSEEKMSSNLAVRRNGRIAAVVGLFPVRWSVGADVLEVAGIGGVSVAPDARGQGLMKRLMRHAVDAMRDGGTPLSFLTGQRQRYAYFGYEVAGNRPDFTISTANFRHAANRLAMTITARALSEDELTAAHRLHVAQPAYCRRAPLEFPRFLSHWWARPLALRRDDALVGYAVIGPAHTIQELVLADPADALDAVRAAMAFLHRDQVQLEIQPTDPRLAEAIGRFAESMVVSSSGNWQVFDWPRVLTALLRAKAETMGVPDGDAMIRIGEQSFALRVRDGDVSCEMTAQHPSLAVDAATAMRLLFGPLPISMSVALPHDSAALGTWCPLPLSISRLDHV